MKFAVFTVSLPEFTPAEAVSELQDAGYDGIEWRVTDDPLMSGSGRTVAGHGPVIDFWSGNRCTLPLATLPGDAPRIRAMTEAAGLAMPNVGTYVSCEEPELVDHAMKGVKALGAPALRVRVPNYDGIAPYRALRDRAIAQYRDVEALARQHALKALIEMHMNNIVPSASACAAFVGHFDPMHVGIIHDCGNMVYEGYEQYRLGLEMLGPYLGHVHLKNSKWEPVGTRPDGSTEWRATFAPITKGIVDMGRLIDALVAVGYDGWVAFEDFSTDVPPAQRIRDNLRYVKSVVRAKQSG
jgi:sugar phosphate isomerase/epimerase